jgi:glyoxylase-like metal-dependent hydrolase (beta-lactamase superfamily II)
MASAPGLRVRRTALRFLTPVYIVINESIDGGIMQLKKLSFTLVSILCIGFSGRADDDFSKEVVRVTPLTATLYMLQGAGGNVTASIGPDGVLLVDCDFAEMSDKLVAKLKELKGSSPRLIINTHFHYDHTGGDQIFGSTATIIAATQVRTRLMSEQVLWKKTHPAFPTNALPILTFDDSVMLHMNGDDIRAVHLPNGHTDGDTVVFFQNENVASLGDLYFSGMYPIFHPEHQGNLNSYLHNIDSILKKIPDGTRIIPGHGPLSNKRELAQYREMIAASIEVVKTGIKRGMTLERLQKQGLPEKWESFSHGYRTTDQWIQSIYQSLKGKD